MANRIIPGNRYRLEGVVMALEVQRFIDAPDSPQEEFKQCESY